MSGPAGPITTRCKQCLNCRIFKQSSLTLRCLLENRSALSAEFWTLTYKDAPETGDYEDFKKFLKRLRARNRRAGNWTPLRYLGCGEYGHKSGRFHFHGLIWNGLKSIGETYPTELWPHGFVYIGTVTPASIRYTARYTLKFETKGQESCAGWSKRPPLGSHSMQKIAQRMLERGDKLTEPPTTFKLEGKTYPLDNAMRIEFAQIFDPTWISTNDKGVRRLNTTTNEAMHRSYVTDKKLGDPIEAQRKHQEARNTFFETARLNNGKL